jgi:hypothetical protein
MNSVIVMNCLQKTYLTILLGIRYPTVVHVMFSFGPT